MEVIDCPAQIIICHNGNLISINSNAWPAHRYHGDIRLDDEDGMAMFRRMTVVLVPWATVMIIMQPLHPAVVEICANNIDDNCNGEIDEDCVAVVAFAIRYGRRKTWM